jgi:glucosamine--fructose-6-phosphate aminotransferase (isomerizing)
MCGIFGTLRPKGNPAAGHQASAAALLTLGAIAEERGSDSAGIATVHSRPLTSRTRCSRHLVDHTSDRVRRVTALGPFSTHIPTSPRIGRSLQSAGLVLGHTRWATQGDVDLSNCSPMLVGQLLGTHNGDVTVPKGPNVAAGSTDSAWLFAQLDRTGTVAAAAAVLTGVRGRAALAWIRTDRPDSLFLARAALSPLAIAFDADGAVWWASNPAWLRRIGREHQLEMSEPRMVLEGTVMELRPALSHVDMVATRRFVPAARPNDQYLTHAVWRGFSAQDLAADRSWLARSITSPDRRAHHPRVQRSGETNASSCSDRSFAESR